MNKFTTVTIIYNPNSTGNGKVLARQLKNDLQEAGYLQPVEIVETEFAGHAIEIAYEKAMATDRALIISSSGDGGYNEVVNGLMKAMAAGAKPVAGVLPAGNANDYFNNVQDKDVKNSITQQKTRLIDLLKIKSMAKQKDFEYYAHSYVGFGLTPKVGKKLNQHELNRFNEIVIALKTLRYLKSTKIEESGKVRAYYSIVAANLKSMSKVLKLSEDSEVDDGKFELIKFARSSKWQLVKTLLHSAGIGLKSQDHVAKYEFKTIRPTLVQVDGEVYTLDGNSLVNITIKNSALECLV